MLEKLDITKPAKEIIIDKFNARSGIHLQYDFVELGNVDPLANPNDKEDTSIELVPTLIAPFLNKFHLRYKRMDLSDIFGAPYLFISSGTFDTLYELLPDINLVTGLNVTVDDVDDAPIVRDPDPLIKPSVNIKCKDTSVFYQGEVTVTLDTDLNVPAYPVQSNSIVYALREVTGGADYITAHAFDGYAGNSFKFLRNVDLITLCKISSMFSCENSTVVLNGQFQFVATNLSFINPAEVYKTITINRVGDILSARTQESILGVVGVKVTRDPIEKFYYVVDTAGTVGQNPKNVYRLFENGTIDAQFNHVTLGDDVVAIVPAKEGYFSIERSSLDYAIKRYTLDGTLDSNFNVVSVKTNSGVFTKVFGFTNYDDFGQEYLHMCMSSDINNVTLAPDFTATQVQTVKSSNVNNFYSPFFTVTDNGDLVIASGELAKYNDREALEDFTWFPELFKDVHGRAVVYSLNSFSIASHQTVTPLMIGDDKEYQPRIVPLQDTQRVTNLKKVFQTYSAYETYVVVDIIRKDNNPTLIESSAILAFGVDHTPNGIIVTENSSNEKIKDVVVLNM